MAVARPTTPEQGFDVHEMIVDEHLLRSGLVLGDVRRTARVGEGVMLVRDDPSAVHLAQADGEPQALSRVTTQLRSRTTAQQCERERDVHAGRDVKFLDVEYRTGGLPLEEAGPGVAIGVETSYATFRWWYVEHHDVGRMVSEHGCQVVVVRPSQRIEA
jgi:hypothetical protein